MNLRAQLEGNSFAELVMRNTPAHTLKADPFATADCKFELGNITCPAAGQLRQAHHRRRLGAGRPDVRLRRERAAAAHGRRHASGTARSTAMPSGINGQAVYDGNRPVDDRIYGGNDNDTFWGREGNDIIDGRGGDDIALGGEGNDIITDLAGFDVPKGGPGNDAIDGGISDDIIMGGDGQRLHQRRRQHQRAFLRRRQRLRHRRSGPRRRLR